MAPCHRHAIDSDGIDNVGLTVPCLPQEMIQTTLLSWGEEMMENENIFLCLLKKTQPP